LCDFGLARIKTETLTQGYAGTTGDVKGTVAWLPPELLKLRPKYTHASDVYAFGMVLWELATRRRPYADAHSEQVIISYIKDGETEEFDDNSPQTLVELVKKAWSKEPAQRPTAAAMVEVLERQQQAAEATEQQHPPQQQQQQNEEAPNEYLCPITGELMEDPVVAADGHTYERAAIEQWFATGRRTSPKTNAVIEARLVPNTQLRILINEYRARHP
jgi:serine/threonine protein kinase